MNIVASPFLHNEISLLICPINSRRKDETDYQSQLSDLADVPFTVSRLLAAVKPNKSFAMVSRTIFTVPLQNFGATGGTTS